MNQRSTQAVISGQEHWTKKGDVKLFLWEKRAVTLSRDRQNAEQGPRLRGCDRGADHERVVADPSRVSGVRSPEGPLFSPTTRPAFGDATVEARSATESRLQESRAADLRERAGSPDGKRGTVLFVHGSSMASQPTFDLKVPGRPDSSVMDWFAQRGFDTWCVDMEGYGRSDKKRDINCDIANGADDLAAATDYIMKTRGTRKFLVYGISSGALRAALFAQRHPERVARLALDAFVWTGEGSPTLAERRKKLPQFLQMKRRPIDRAFVRSIFERDHPGCAEKKVIEAFADAILALDDSMPTGTYVDMCSKLPVVDPQKIAVPTMVMRGEFDGIAGFDDLVEFFKRLPNSDKQFAVMAGIAHASFQQINYLLAYHILHSFFSQPPPVYEG
jgi:pimeloyl-ACP methyl ester carboxylesterase